MAKKRRRQRVMQGSKKARKKKSSEGTKKKASKEPSESRRRSPRVPVRRRVRVKHEDAVVSGVTQDIGWGGIFVRTEDVLPEGAAVELKVQLHQDEQPILVSGNVVRACSEGPEAGMAIAFHGEASEPEVQLLATFVREEDLNIRAERLQAAKEEFLAEVRTFQEEKIAFEREAAIREITGETTAAERPKRDALALKEEVRRAKHEYLEKIEDAEARRRANEADLELERQQLAREREAVAQERRDIEAEREQIDQEGNTLRDELTQERKLSADKEAARQGELEGQLDKLQQRLTALVTANETLEARCRAFEQQKDEEVTKTSAHAADVAQLRAHAARLEAQHETSQTKLGATIEHLTEEVEARERELETIRRDAKFRVWRLERQIQRVRAYRESVDEELDQLDEARAHAIVQLELSEERRVELEAEVTRLKLELDEASTRLEFKEAMFEDLRERVETQHKALEAQRRQLAQRCQQLEATVAHLSAAGQPQPPAQVSSAPAGPLPLATQPTPTPVSEWFGELPPVSTGGRDDEDE